MKKIKFISALSILACLWMLYYISSCTEKDPLAVQGNIEGTVADVETSQSISGVSVTIVANSSTTFVEQSKITGTDGKFSFKNIEAGSYKLSFSKEGYEDNSKNINLTAGQTSSSDVMLKPIKPVLHVSTVLLDFGTTNNILPIEITNTGKGELDWSIVEDLAWLSANPVTGKTATTPASVTVSIDRSRFSEISKTGTFVINSNGGSTTVNVTASKEIPVLQVSTIALDFGTETNNLPFEIANIGQGELTWNIVEDLTWLSVSATTGKTVTDAASAVTVTVDRSQLQEISKTATFLVNSNAGTATVNVYVGKPSPVLQVFPTSLNFEAETNNLSFEIFNAGQGELTWSIVEDLTWLSASPTTGKTVNEAASVVTVTVDRSQLPEMSKAVTFLVNSNAGTATVNVYIDKPLPVLSVSATSLNFGTTTNNLPFEIANIGQGELNWNITEELDWLSVNPVSGNTTVTAASTVTVTVDRTLIPESSITATFHINSNDETATVNVYVGKPSPVLSVSATSLDFGEIETEKSISVSNIGAGTLNYVASSSKSWITFENAIGSVTDVDKTIKVKVARSGLTAGNYNGNVVISSNANSVTVPVSMKVIQATAPNVFNGKASDITWNSAQVSANLASLGSAAVTEHGHCWSTSPNPTVADHRTTLGGTGVLNSFTSSVTGLNANTRYYVKAYAINEAGTAYSSAITFTTLPPPTAPDVINGQANNITHNSAQVSAQLTSPGTSEVTEHGHCWSTSSSPTVADSRTALGGASVATSFTSNITGLNANTFYYVKAYAINAVGIAYSDAIIITTSPAPAAPGVLNGKAGDITYTSAQISAELTSSGTSTVTQHGHCWSTSPNPTVADSKTTLGATNELNSFTSNITGLNVSTLYYVKAYATNAVGTVYSDAVTFTTLSPTVATVYNGLASNITHNTAQVLAALTSLGGAAITQHGHCWSTSPDPDVADSKTTLGATNELKSFTSNITGLSANTTYYVKAYATNAVGSAYSDAVTFTTLPVPAVPDVLKGQTSDITWTSAQVSATLTSFGTAAVTQHGHCWSRTSLNPTTADNKTPLGGTGELKSFTSNISGLSVNTIYYVKAYATNAVGTAYSDVITLSTLPPTIATVQTTRTQNAKHNQIDGVGNLTVLGGSLVTDYGFCYSTSNTMPATHDSKVSLGQTNQTGSFVVTVTGLNPSTKYYLRPYAVNSAGTAYGDVVEATTADAPFVVTNGLVAYYTFDDENCDEAQGKTEYNGTKHGDGNPVWSTDIPGYKGKSLHLENNAYYTVQSIPVTNNYYEFTYSIWLKTVNVNNTVINFETTDNRGNGIQISTDKYLQFISYNVADVSDLLLDGNWHLLNISYNYYSYYYYYYLYIDGIRKVFHIGQAITGTMDMFIGNGFIGKMDNLRIYNRVLTDAEITEIYNAKQ
jgi:hypothetical protein